MSCEHIRPQLIGFHFGAAPRDEIEAHLLACPACLRELFDLQRALERGDDGPAPSERAKARLRNAVLRAIAPVRPWHVPFAFAFAASMVLASWAAMAALTAP